MLIELDLEKEIEGRMEIEVDVCMNILCLYARMYA